MFCLSIGPYLVIFSSKFGSITLYNKLTNNLIGTFFIFILFCFFKFSLRLQNEIEVLKLNEKMTQVIRVL